jgi:phage tail P2-like protein
MEVWKMRERLEGYDIYSVNFADYLPDALKQDPKMVALANAMAAQLLEASGLIDDVLIYARIDELPEDLVDILAYDMHVDWYDYSYPLDVKRDLLKTSVRVHRKKGTKYAVEKALGGLYKDSEVEEWFEYGGEPFHFRVVCDVSANRIVASYSEIVNAVRMYKRLSAHLDEVAYQSRIYLTVYTHTDAFLYKTPMTGRLKTGTYPYRNVKGAQAEAGYIVGTQSAGFMFKVPLTGTKPYRSTVFASRAEQIDADTALEYFAYETTLTGKKKTGQVPQYSYKGAVADTAVVNVTKTEDFMYTVPMAGTKPQRNTEGGVQDGGIAQSAEASVYTHKVKLCGSKLKL